MSQWGPRGEREKMRRGNSVYKQDIMEVALEEKSEVPGNMPRVRERGKSV